MKALQFAQTGSLDDLELVEVAKPALRAGEVLVELKAAGLNPSDVKNVLGRFPYTTVPRIAGRYRPGRRTTWRGVRMWTPTTNGGSACFVLWGFCGAAGGITATPGGLVNRTPRKPHLGQYTASGATSAPQFAQITRSAPTACWQ